MSFLFAMVALTDRIFSPVYHSYLVFFLLTTVWSTCGPSDSPAWFAAHSCALTKFTICSHDTLSTSQQFHFTRGIVYVTIRATSWPIFWCAITINGTRFTNCWRICTLSNMSQWYCCRTNTTRLYPKHTSTVVDFCNSIFFLLKKMWLCVMIFKREKKWLTTDLNTFDRLCHTRDLYRLDNDAYRPIQLLVRIHLVLPKRA